MREKGLGEDTSRVYGSLKTICAGQPKGRPADSVSLCCLPHVQTVRVLTRG